MDNYDTGEYMRHTSIQGKTAFTIQRTLDLKPFVLEVVDEAMAMFPEGTGITVMAESTDDLLFVVTVSPEDDDIQH